MPKNVVQPVESYIIQRNFKGVFFKWFWLGWLFI